MMNIFKIIQISQPLMGIKTHTHFKEASFMKKSARFLFLILTLVLCLGLVPGTAFAMEGVEVTRKGQVVDTITFNGVTVEAIYAPRSSVPNYGSNPTYCCAAFVSKFYSKVYGVQVDHLLRKYNGPRANKGSFSVTTTPQVGDIVHKKTTDATHWAIVKSVSGNTVTLIEQNGWKDTSNGRSIARVGKTVTVGDKDWTFYRYSDAVIETKNDNRQPTEIADGVYTISPKCASSSCLDVKDGSKASKANIQIWPANGTASQQFKLTKRNDGFYTIRAQVSSKMLDVAGGKKTSGTNVWQYFYNLTSSQKWRLEDAGNGYWYIIPKLNTSLALDVSGGGSEKGTNVQVYTKNDSDAQKWLLTPVSSDSGAPSSHNTPEPIPQPTPQPHVHSGGSYLFFEADHPHYVYYTCGTCGEKYNTGATVCYEKCTTCNPPKAASSIPSGAREARIIDQYNLWVHSAPNGSKSTRVGKIPAGSDCLVFPAKQSGSWFWVKYGDLEGYVIYDGVILK